MSDLANVAVATEAATTALQTSTSSGSSKYNKFGWGALAGVGATLLIGGGIFGVTKLVSGGKKKKKKSDDEEEIKKPRRKTAKAKKTKDKAEKPDEEIEDEDEEEETEE